VTGAQGLMMLQKPLLEDECSSALHVLDVVNAIGKRFSNSAVFKVKFDLEG